MKLLNHYFKGMYSIPKNVNNKLEHFLKKKDIVYDRKRTVDNSVKDI